MNDEAASESAASVRCDCAHCTTHVARTGEGAPDDDNDEVDDGDDDGAGDGRVSARWAASNAVNGDNVIDLPPPIALCSHVSDCTWLENTARETSASLVEVPKVTTIAEGSAS